MNNKQNIRQKNNKKMKGKSKKKTKEKRTNSPITEEQKQSKIRKRVKRLNEELLRIKIFVFIFCVISIALNTYHIRRLKDFSESLSKLMNVHANTIRMLNTFRQIKDTKDDSHGLLVDNKVLDFSQANLTLRTFYTEKNKKQPQPLFPGLDAKEVEQKRDSMLFTLKEEMTYDIEVNTLLVDDFYIAQNFIASHDIQSKSICNQCLGSAIAMKDEKNGCVIHEAGIAMFRSIGDRSKGTSRVMMRKDFPRGTKSNFVNKI
jgi:hypothetical protein